MMAVSTESTKVIGVVVAVLLFSTGCGGSAVEECATEEQSLEFDQTSEAGFAAEDLEVLDADDSIGSGFAFDVEADWHVEGDPDPSDTNGGDDECPPGEVLNPVTGECVEETGDGGDTSGFDGRSNNWVNFDRDSVRFRTYAPAREAGATCPNSEMELEAELSSDNDARFGSAWEGVAIATDPGALTITAEKSLADYQGTLEIDGDEDTDFLILKHTIDGDTVSGGLYLELRNEHDLREGTEALAVWTDETIQ